MKLDRLLRSARRHLVAALVVGAVLGLLTTAFSMLTAKETYTASNTMLFQVNGLERIADPSNATNYATSMASSYSSMITGPTIVQPVAQQLGMDETELSAGLRVASPRQNMLSTIAYEDPDQEKAKAVVTAVGQQLRTVVDRTTDKVGNRPRVAIASQQVTVSPTPGTAPSLVQSLLKGIVVGLMGLLGYLLVRVLLDRRIHDSRDLAEVTDSSVLADLSDEPAAAALARALRFVDAGRPQLVAITSPTGKEPTARVALATARAMAQQAPGRVLLVDADLRDHAVSTLAGAQGVGLADVAAGLADAGQAVHEADGLAVLGAGSGAPNSTELLAGEALPRLLEQLGGRYETILLATAPLLPNSDGLLAADRARATVVVAGAKTTRLGQLEQSLGLLQSVGVTPAGLVLTRFKG